MNTKNTNPILRQHQKDALTAIRKVITKGEGKGRIVLPTGTGKTRIEAETICEIAKIRQNKNSWAGVHVILAPRILLAYQQLSEFLEITARNGLECDYMVVNSGGLTSADYEKQLLKLGFNSPDEIVSSTSVNDISNHINKSKANNRLCLIFATYHSVDRVDLAARQTATQITSYIFDEAQYCVTSGEFQQIPYYEALFKFSFTATEKWTDADDGHGLNNEEKFGKLLFCEKPAELIKRGEMTSVAIHLVGTRGQNIEDTDYESMAKVIIDAFDKHRSVLKAHSAQPEIIGPKMVVICHKQDALRGIMQSKVLKAYKLQHQSINLCALSTDYGIQVNGERTPRANHKDKEFLLKRMKSWNLEDEAIVLHIDMIAEGINVPGITAIMPFRGLGKIKFQQNTGRGTRLIDIDRLRLYSGAIQPKNWKSYVKPYCWLILPLISFDYYDQKRRYTDWIRTLRADYGFNSREMVVIDNIVGPPDSQPLDDMVGVTERRFNTGLGLIEEIVHSIEDGEAMSEFMEHAFSFKRLQLDQQLKLLEEIYAE